MLFAGVCNAHDAPLSDKMDGLYGAHTFTPSPGAARPARGGEGATAIAWKLHKDKALFRQGNIRSFSYLPELFVDH